MGRRVHRGPRDQGLADLLDDEADELNGEKSRDQLDVPRSGTGSRPRAAVEHPGEADHKNGRDENGRHRSEGSLRKEREVGVGSRALQVLRGGPEAQLKGKEVARLGGDKAKAKDRQRTTPPCHRSIICSPGPIEMLGVCPMSSARRDSTMLSAPRLE